MPDSGPIAGPSRDDAALFRAVARSVQDAIIAADEQSRIVFWNGGAETIFGWSAAEIIGRSLTELMPERFRAAHRAGVERVTEGGEAHVIGGPPVELVGLRADGDEFPIELTLGRWEDDQGSGFTGVVRDVSERVRLDQVVRTQYEVAAALAGAQELGPAVEGALEAIVTGMGWRLGQVWALDDQRRLLRYQAGWSAEPEAVAPFREVSETGTFAHGEGLPGRVWASGSAEWLGDLADVANFPRRDAALRCGLHGGVAAPLAADGRTYGVVEFFTSDAEEPEARVLTAVEAVGRQLGQFLLRRRAEAELAARERQRAQAAELNDEVVQGLALAHYHLAGGQAAAAADAVAETLAAARGMVSNLLEGVDVEPGRLRRTQAARVTGDGG